MHVAINLFVVKKHGCVFHRRCSGSQVGIFFSFLCEHAFTDNYHCSDFAFCLSSPKCCACLLCGTLCNRSLCVIHTHRLTHTRLFMYPGGCSIMFNPIFFFCLNSQFYFCFLPPDVVHTLDCCCWQWHITRLNTYADWTVSTTHVVSRLWCAFGKYSEGILLGK